MKRFLHRLYFLLAGMLSVLSARAQMGDDTGDFQDTRRGQGALDDMEDMFGSVEGLSLNIGFSDIMLVLVIVVACYVFGKIWRGCTYLIIAAAAIMYFFMR